MKGYWLPLLITLALTNCTEEGPHTAETRGLEQLASSGSVRAQTELGIAYEMLYDPSTNTAPFIVHIRA